MWKCDNVALIVVSVVPTGTGFIYVWCVTRIAGHYIRHCCYSAGSQTLLLYKKSPLAQRRQLVIFIYVNLCYSFTKSSFGLLKSTPNSHCRLVAILFTKWHHTLFMMLRWHSCSKNKMVNWVCGQMFMDM